MTKDRRFVKGSFPYNVHHTMKRKGWFRVKDIVDMYREHRGYRKGTWKDAYMSCDASDRLHSMCKVGSLERKPDPKYNHRFVYRTVPFKKWLKQI